MAFWKLSGAGNDFVAVDGRGGLPLAADELARRACPRRTAVGADGLLVVAAITGDRVDVDYYNADGSAAGFCGNGARCAARYAVEALGAPADLTLAMPSTAARSRVRADEVELTLPRPRIDRHEVELPVEGDGPRRARLVEAGVPHLVVPGDARTLEHLARRLAQTSDLLERYNLTVMQPEADGVLAIHTHERGSGLTLACGSAALAAAAVAASSAGVDCVTLTVLPPSRIPLRVVLGPGREEALLAGEARRVFRGELDLS
jgi:diaminopimelate epimerase